MISHMGISAITPLAIRRGGGGEALSYRGISVITPLPFGGGDGVGASILSASSPWSVTSVGETPNDLLCVLTVTVESPMCFSCFYEKP